MLCVFFVSSGEASIQRRSTFYDVWRLIGIISRLSWISFYCSDANKLALISHLEYFICCCIKFWQLRFAFHSLLKSVWCLLLKLRLRELWIIFWIANIDVTSLRATSRMLHLSDKQLSQNSNITTALLSIIGNIEICWVMTDMSGVATFFSVVLRSSKRSC